MRKHIAFLAAATLCVSGLASPAAAQQGRDRGSQDRGGQERGGQMRGQDRGAQERSSADRGRGDMSRSDQANAREEMRAGRTMPSREIERRIVPQMKGSDYLGFEYDSSASAYRLKFLKEGQVTWVDVDARTGRVLRVK